jgi:hypothetical protein
MLKDFLTKNITLKAIALVIAVVLWVIARYWLGH